MNYINTICFWLGKKLKEIENTKSFYVCRRRVKVFRLYLRVYWANWYIRKIELLSLGFMWRQQKETTLWFILIYYLSIFIRWNWYAESRKKIMKKKTNEQTSICIGKYNWKQWFVNHFSFILFFVPFLFSFVDSI